ncbi:MAG: hypothetical protein DWQ37_09015 [Planctomycetota bacterium]|nr:MAG: hypothetical protein DWQ37_09015 [Planctomycetota bacterium]
MREHLIGYVLDALEPSERAMVEARLSRDPQLQRDMEVLKRGLEPLGVDKAHYDAPIGLASRTCEFVAVQTKAKPAPQPVTSVSSNWSMADMLVAAGIFLAASLLFWPAMNQSRFAAQVRGCQNRMGQIGVALANYSNLYPRQLPSLEVDHELNHAGMYAVLLREHGLMPRTHILLCPASPLAERPEEFTVPTREQLIKASPQERLDYFRQMGGSYAYNLGYFEDGRYHPPRDLRQANQALLADMPSGTAEGRSSQNHGGCGQNVLFGDMHVKYLTSCKRSGCEDHIFLNKEGKPYAGLDRNDIVLGASHDVPLAPSATQVPLHATP